MTDLSSLSTEQLLDLLKRKSAADSMPKPPKGVIIHGGDGKSYSASDPSISVERSQSIAGNADEGRAQMAEQEALRRRASGQDFGAARAAMPFYQGVSMGGGDEVASAAAALTQPGTFGDNYAVNQEMQRQELARERKENPVRSIAGEVAGGLATGIAASAGASLTASRFIPQAASGARGLAMRAGAGALDGVAYGATQGALSARSGERGEGAATGAMIGGAAGVAAPVVGATLRKGADVLRLSPVADRARDRIAYLLQRSRMSPDDVKRSLAEARADGQPEFTIADALGRSGRNEAGRLSRTASDFGDDMFRQAEQRQLGASRRVGTMLDEAATGQPGRTAQEVQGKILAVRGQEAKVNYDAARQAAGAVDVSGAIKAADDFLQPGASAMLRPQSGIADDSVESAVRRARAFLSDGKSQVTNFDAALRAKIEIDAMIERAAPSVQRQLIAVRNALDGALEQASAPYAQARNAFRSASQAADAVDTGADMYRSGRFEDNVNKFGAMDPRQQAAAKVGYASRAVEDVRGNPEADATKPLRGLDRQEELGAMFGPDINRKIGRERTMFETYGEIAKGSQTAGRIAEDVAGDGMGAQVGGVVMDAATFNGPGIARRALDAGLSALRGESEGTKQAIARIIMSNQPETVDELRQMLMARGVSNRNIDTIVRSLMLSTGQTIAAQ